MEAIAAAILIIAGVIGVIFLLALFNTWVASVLWTWFVTPAFVVAAPPLYVIYGLALFVQLFVHTQSNAEKKNIDVLAEGIIKSIVILVLAWIAHGLFA